MSHSPLSHTLHTVSCGGLGCRRCCSGGLGGIDVVSGVTGDLRMVRLQRFWERARAHLYVWMSIVTGLSTETLPTGPSQANPGMRVPGTGRRPGVRGCGSGNNRCWLLMSRSLFGLALSLQVSHGQRVESRRHTADTGACSYLQRVPRVQLPYKLLRHTSRCETGCTLARGDRPLPSSSVSDELRE